MYGLKSLREVVCKIDFLVGCYVCYFDGVLADDVVNILNEMLSEKYFAVSAFEKFPCVCMCLWTI